MVDPDIELRSRAFVLLKRVCDELITTLNQENVQNVIELVNVIPSDVFAHLSDYVLFPIRLHLCKFVTATSKFE